MNMSELDLILQQGEGYNVEFKQSISKDIPEEICAFANAAGGTMLIGVRDDNTVCGIQTDNVTRSRIMHSLRAIDPKLEVSYEETVYNGSKLICLTCGTGHQKPYIVSGSIFIRIGPNSQKITSVEEMRDFFQQSERIYFDECPCTEFKLPDALDSNALNRFLAAARISNSLPRNTLLENLKLIAADGKLKNGAVLFFGKNVQAFFDKAVIRCLQYKGVDKRFIMDDKLITGNLLLQYHGAIKYIMSKLNLSYEIESQGIGPRREVLEIPEIVFKEALVNALTHRDYYDKGATTMIEVFDDRVEITNPGGLVSSVPRDQFGTRSLSRNPLIFGLFERINMVEQVGSGVGRMKNAMKEANLPEPVFNVEGMFSITLHRPANFDQWMESWKSKLTETRVKMLRLIYKNPSISKKELSMQLGISSTAIDKNVHFLRQQNLIERAGPDRGGKWKIVMKKAE